MRKEPQIIRSDKEYAGQDKQLQTIPFGNIDKTICGCGLTTVALESKEDVIIAMPTVPLVINKVEQYPNNRCHYRLFPVYAKVTETDVENYIDECRKNEQPIKIITTYDGVRKVEKYLNVCRLIIDESNQILSLTKEGSRKDNILKMLDIAEENKNTVSLISATPIDLKYMPKWIGEIEQVKIIWKDTQKSVPILYERTYPFKALREEIIKPIELNGSVTSAGQKFSSVIVFLNSVQQITKIIKDCKLNKDDCKIICGDSLKNDFTISGISRYKVKDTFKYLFITKSGFSGMDIESKDAMTVVISNTAKEWQMVDVLTDLKQAVSRQRLKNNPNYGHFIYIYNQSIFTYSEEELIENLEKKKYNFLQSISLYEDAKALGKKDGFMTNADFLAYTRYDENADSYILNESALNADMYYLIETKRQYTKGFDIKGNFKETKEVKPIKYENTATYANLVDFFNVNNINGSLDWGEYEHKTDWISLIESSYKLYKKAWKDITYAKKMVENYGDSWELLKIHIRKIFRKGNRYTRKEIKETLQLLYDKEGIVRKAKYSDLYEVFRKEQIKEGAVNGVRHLDIV